MKPYLYAHPNPHAPRRANGVRFHGYPRRPVAPRVIALHTTESLFDQAGQDGGAESVARYQSTTDRPSSYHRIVDRDSTVVCLPDEAVAFGIGNLNSPTLHLSLAMRADDWRDPAKAKAAAPTLERAAQVAAEWCRAYAIPVRRITRDQAFGDGLGFLAHGDADPARRSDPGLRFPWVAFLARVQQLVNGNPHAPAPTTSEDIDVTQQELQQMLDAAVLKVTGGRRERGQDGRVIDRDTSHVSNADVLTALDDVSASLATVHTRLDALEAARGSEV